MQIDTIEIKLLSIPLSQTITTHVRTFNKLDCLALSIKKSLGFTGNSFIRGGSQISVQEIKTHIETKLTDLLNRTPVLESESIWNNVWRKLRHNPNKVGIYSLAAIDIAMWDIFSKKKNLPLHKVLGATRNQVPLYGTTGWLSLSRDALIMECKKYARLGVNGFKIRLGSKDDYERVKSVREAMGNEYRLMLDANQRYHATQAIQVAQQMHPFNITWLEEPVGNSLIDLQQVKSCSPVQIAVGENIGDFDTFSKICKSKAADFLQPDVVHCGGITGFLEIANLAKKYNVPLCNHLIPELSASLVASFPNGYLLEYDDLLPADIFTQDFSIRDGYMTLPDVPGTGVELTKDALKHYSVL